MLLTNLTPSSKGMADLQNILDLVKNADVYEERIKSLKQATREANNATSKLTKAKDLDKALINAKDKQAKADEVINHANEKAKQVTDDAIRDAARIVREAHEKAEQSANEVAQARNDLNNLEAQIDTNKQELAQIEDKAIKTQGRADKLLKEAQQTKREANEKSKALKLAMDAV